MIVHDELGREFRLHFYHDTDLGGRRRVEAMLHPASEPCERSPKRCSAMFAMIGLATCSKGKPKRGIKPDNFSYEIGRSIALGRALALNVSAGVISRQDRKRVEAEYRNRPRA